MSNYKLKHAVTAALSVLAVGFQPTSFAIGLSDIQLKSNLGEPLKATINVLGAADLESASCLRLGGNSDLKNINFHLGKVSGGQAALTLTSNKVINEPIVNLSVVAGCENSITRDYVLLLDPPTSYFNSASNSPNVEVTAVEDVTSVKKVDSAAKTSTAEATAPAQALKTKAQQKVRSAKKKTAKQKTVSNGKKVTKQLAGTTQVSRQSTPKATSPSSDASKARLSISSGYPTGYAATTGLRLDKQLKFTPDPNAVINSEAIAIEDEVTVMNNRLAHLQAQITALQTQNAKLKQENEQQSQQLATKAAEPSFSGFLPGLGAGFLLFSAGFAGYHWYRRRQLQIQDHRTNAIWVNTQDNDDHAAVAAEETTETTTANENEPATEKAEEIFADVDFGINSTIDAPVQEGPSAEDTTAEDTTTQETMESTFASTSNEEAAILLEDEQQFSVLDHADVFLSHGRAPLAIQLLQNHLLEHPKQSVTIWLFLLDLLAKENLEELYKETALDCKLHYNVEIADFSKQEESNNESLEDFPRLAKGLEDVWNTPAAVVYLDDLIYNNRLEPRAGLSKNLIEELVLLREMANENAASAEVIRLDEKKLAIIEQKEALLESKKAEKLKKLEEEAEQARLEKEAQTKSDDETSFEFTLVEHN